MALLRIRVSMVLPRLPSLRLTHLPADHVLECEPAATRVATRTSCCAWRPRLRTRRWLASRQFRGQSLARRVPSSGRWHTASRNVMLANETTSKKIKRSILSYVSRAGMMQKRRHLQDSNLRGRTQCLANVHGTLAGHRLNHSAKVSRRLVTEIRLLCTIISLQLA